MPATPDSSASSYLTPAEFLKRYDARMVGQYVSDSGVKVDPSALLSDPNLLSILADASAEVEQAALVGGRYTSADLNALVSSTTVGGDGVRRLVADLAMGMLRQRRGMVEDQPMPQYQAAQRRLQDLRTGQIIFPFVEAQAAGRAHTKSITEDEFLRQGRITSVFRRFWGTRPDQINQ